MLTVMHTILTKVVPDNLKACLRFVRHTQLMYAKWIPSIDIPLLHVQCRYRLKPMDSFSMSKMKINYYFFVKCINLYGCMNY